MKFAIATIYLLARPPSLSGIGTLNKMIIHDKLETSIKNLVAWVDKILTESRSREWRRNDFLSNYDISDLLRFYNELLPYINHLKTENNAVFGKQADLYIKNGVELKAAMKSNFFYDLMANTFLETLFDRSADDVMEALRNILSNVKNLEYAVKIQKA